MVVFHQIRHSTAIITFGNKKFLLDPVFADKETYPGIPGSANSEVRWPRVPLPMPIKDILSGIDAVVITHHHPDHIDEIAARLLPSGLKLFVQDEVDATVFRTMGFTNIEVLSAKGSKFGDVTLFRTSGIHGKGEAVRNGWVKAGLRGDVCGVVFSAPTEPKKLYVAGDTVWCDEVKQAVDQYHPEIIVVNACRAELAGEAIVMGKEDVAAVCAAAPEATVIASHMDTVNHLTLTRPQLWDFVASKNLSSRVLIPQDGEVCRF